MNRSILLAVAFALSILANSASAATFGHVSLYGDAASTECTLTDDQPRTADVFVVHHIGEYVADAYLLAFRVAASAGFTGSWLQDIVPTGMFAVGTSPDGMTIGYQACRTGDVPVLRITYQLFGTSSPCSSLQVAAYPDIGFIETSNCSFEIFMVEGGSIVVNADDSCPCQMPVPVKQTTWGAVKAIYR